MVQLGDCASILISHWWDFLGESYVMIVMTAVIFCVCIFSAYFYHHSNIKSKWTYVLGNHNGTDVFKVTAFFVYVLTHFLFSMTPYANSNHDVINDDIMTTDDNDVFCNERRFFYTLRGPFFQRTYISSTVTPTDIIRLHRLCHRLLCNNSAETIL